RLSQLKESADRQKAADEEALESSKKREAGLASDVERLQQEVAEAAQNLEETKAK
ncbi:unnamed protein product, partial [Symbiodinium sp. CCMP2456]